MLNDAHPEIPSVGGANEHRTLENAGAKTPAHEYTPSLCFSPFRSFRKTRPSGRRSSFCPFAYHLLQGFYCPHAAMALGVRVGAGARNQPHLERRFQRRIRVRRKEQQPIRLWLFHPQAAIEASL